jgi:hypothetical protein
MEPTRRTIMRITNITPNTVSGHLKVGSPLRTLIEGIARIYAAEKTA